MEGTRRAVARYREAEATANPLTLPPGRKVLRDVCKPLIKAITAAQAEAKAALGTAVKPHLWSWPIQLVEADKMSVLVLSVALGNLQSGGSGRTLCLVDQARRIAVCVRDEVEYGRWQAAQDQANAEAKKRKDEDHHDLLKALKRTYPSLDRRTWAKWRAKVKALREEPWGAAVETALGCYLIALLVDAAPNHFVLKKRALIDGRTQLYLAPTDGCSEAMADIKARAEVSRPALMPMIIPPNPWRYDDPVT